MQNEIFYGIYFNDKSNINKNVLKDFSKDIDYLNRKNIRYHIPADIKETNINFNKLLLLNEKKYMLEVEINLSNKKLVYRIQHQQYECIEDIVNKYKVLPKLFIENININKYANQLADIGLNKDKIYIKEKEKINKIVNSKFNVLYGLDSIYEPYTGAVYFNDNEWCKISDNNTIKKLFEKKDNESYKYMLALDDGNILRGADIYYFFSSDVNKYIGPTKKQINKWTENCKSFLNDTLNALQNFKINNNYDLRLLLAIIDNIRNLVLLLTNVRILTLYHLDSFIITVDEMKKDNYLSTLISLIDKYQELILDICLNKKDDADFISPIYDMCVSLHSIIIEIVDEVYTISNQYTINKCFNPLREIDNYFENYIVMNYSSNYIHNERLSLIGILYGGLELPFILKKCIKDKCNISLVYQNKGMYLDRQNSAKNVCTFRIKNIGNYDYTKSNNYLLDDNIMSGMTSQHIINELFGINCEINGQIVVRHANINRLPQIKFFDCAIDLNFVDNFYIGMLTNTPYSKIKFGTNYDNMFVNELNIFSVMTEVFLKALYINNSFIRNSEVDIFRGYSTGRLSADDIVQYNNEYYKKIMNENKYLYTNNILENILNLSNVELQERWLCGLNLKEFINCLNSKQKTIITMGIGINGTPHIGTLSQILKCIRLQEAGFKVQIVLGDLDVYNARAQEIEEINKLTAKYKNFIISLGFDINKGIIRSQYNSDSVAKTACLIAPFIEDEEFEQLEEDIYVLYKNEKKYSGMTFSVKESILLMFADFLDLGISKGYKNIMILSGIDEHIYTKKALEIAKRMNLDINISGLFSKIIKAINDYPKMSKSLKGSSIDLNISKNKLKDIILNNKDNNFIYDLMLNSTKYNINKLLELKKLSQTQTKDWEIAKEKYIEDFIKICKEWRKNEK